MAHIFLADGRSLRLRLFPRPKRAPGRRKRVPTSLSLFDVPHEDDAVDTPAEKLAARVAELCLLNRNNAEILKRMPKLGIRDYDVCYFSDDTSWEAEDQVIRDGAALFADLAVNVQLRNQARVHLWYPEKFGVAYPPLTTASEGILRFTSSVQAIGMKRTGDEFIDVYAPFGLGDVWDIVARPNRALPMAHVYAEKTTRWRMEWDKLVIYQWVDEDESGRRKS